MSLSVVIPTFNERDHLARCLDALAERTSQTEVIVVNAPSTDGTSGMIHERDDVDMLLECASRNINVARNAGIREATHPIVALLGATCQVQSGWQPTIQANLSGAADAASGPIHPGDPRGDATDRASDRGLGINGENVALTREAITALDGFDEYLSLGGTADLATRLSGHGLNVMWHPEMEVHRIMTADGGESQRRNVGRQFVWGSADPPDWGDRYRALAYRSVKNDGIRPRVLGRLLSWAIRDGVSAALEVFRGRGTPTQWVGNGVDVVTNVLVGMRDGRNARSADGTTARNPHGLSHERSIEAIADTHDWRRVP